MCESRTTFIRLIPQYTIDHLPMHHAVDQIIRMNIRQAYEAQSKPCQLIERFELLLRFYVHYMCCFLGLNLMFLRVSDPGFSSRFCVMVALSCADEPSTAPEPYTCNMLCLLSHCRHLVALSFHIHSWKQSEGILWSKLFLRCTSMYCSQKVLLNWQYEIWVCAGRYYGRGE